MTREVFEHSETLDATGKRQSVQYPVCVERDGGCGPTQPRTLLVPGKCPEGVNVGKVEEIQERIIAHHGKTQIYLLDAARILARIEAELSAQGG